VIEGRRGGGSEREKTFVEVMSIGHSFLQIKVKTRNGAKCWIMIA